MVVCLWLPRQHFSHIALVIPMCNTSIGPCLNFRETRPAEEKETTNDEYYLTDDDMFDPEFEV